MERLTYRNPDGSVGLNAVFQSENWMKIFERIAEYEDAEEQGLLLRLPCRPDEMVWCADEFGTRQVMYGSASSILCDIEHGKGIGYTQAEAEKALAELQSK